MFQFSCPPLPHFIVCGEDTYAPGALHPNRSGIGVFDLLVVTRGLLQLEENGIPYQVPAGHFLILRPDLAHRTREPSAVETHFYWLHFQTSGEWSDSAPLPSLAAPQPRHDYMSIDPFAFALPRTGAAQSAEALYARLRDLLALQGDSSAASAWRAQMTFHALLLQLQKESGAAVADPYRTVADEAAAFLRRHFREPVSYSRLAEALHFHPNHIALCMKKAFGCTPLDYLIRYRVEQAKQLLVRTNEPVGSVAELTGFGSFPYFSRCFTRHTGISPKAFRMQYRGRL